MRCDGALRGAANGSHGRPSDRELADTHLDEANELSLLAEASAADVQVVLADQTAAGVAHTAARAKKRAHHTASVSVGGDNGWRHAAAGR